MVVPTAFAADTASFKILSYPALKSNQSNVLENILHSKPYFPYINPLKYTMYKFVTFLLTLWANFSLW